MLDLLALDHRYLTICDALPNHANLKVPIRETAMETTSVLREGGHHDDDSGPEQGDRAAGAHGRTPPTPTPPARRGRRRVKTTISECGWPHSIAWNDLGFSDADVPGSKNFVPA